MKRPEPVQVVKQRRDAALNALVGSVPYLKFMGIVFDRRGDEITGTMPYDEKLIGNPILPALHGGATSAFMENTALIELSWQMLWDEMENGELDAAELTSDNIPRLPKTINFSVDYLRSGLPRDAYSRARVIRSGRRYASVQVDAWQDNRDRPIAQAVGHFVMPKRND